MTKAVTHEAQYGDSNQPTAPCNDHNRNAPTDIKGNKNESSDHHQTESQQSFTIRLTFILAMTKAATHEAEYVDSNQPTAPCNDRNGNAPYIKGNENESSDHHQSESQRSFMTRLTFILVMTKAATHEAKIRRLKPADGTM